MRKILIVIFCLGFVATNDAFAQGRPLSELVIYDEPTQQNTANFIPSGWMGDYGAVKVDDKFTQNPYSGSYCQQWIYSIFMPPKQGWTGVYWQYPANNWGKLKGLDLTGYTRLTFWARGQTGEEIVSFKVGGINGTYSDTLSIELSDVKLTPEWQQYTIALFGEDLSNVIGGFSWAVSREKNPRGCTFYLDKILYE